MARRNAAVERSRASRKRQRRLGDEIVRIGLELASENLALRGAGVRAHEHAVAARAVDLLDHQFVEIVEHMGKLRWLAAAKSRHVLQQRLLFEIEADDVGDIAINRLIVGDASADCIGKRHIARQIGAHQPGHAQQRGGIEHQRIEEVVIHSAVDHVDTLRPARRAHVNDVLGDEQIAPFDQFDAELVGEERMLVICRIERSRRQQRDGRILAADARRDRAQARQQFVGISLNWRDAMLGEQVRQQPHRYFAIFQHVGNARRRAGIVLQHIKIVAVDAHDVDAGDMHPDVVRRPAADHFRPVIRIAQDQVGRNQAFLQDRAGTVNVAQEHVERVDALGDASFKLVPFGARDQPWNNVERDEPLRRVLVAIDAEGDADAAKHELGLGAPGGEHVGRRLLEPALDVTVERARSRLTAAHFIEKPDFRHQCSPPGRHISKMLARPIPQEKNCSSNLPYFRFHMAPPSAPASASAPVIGRSTGQASKSPSSSSAVLRERK